jgi:hypothetical protein
MKRNPEITETFPDPVREAVGLSIGIEGGYYVGVVDRFSSQAITPDVTNHNAPPAGQPGLWVQWIPTEDGEWLEWDGNEKFYDYIEWLEYLIEHFLSPWGYVLNGTVKWRGEEFGDIGIIIVDNNVVSTEDVSW